jgi:ABC-2 type transport system permease protein
VLVAVASVMVWAFLPGLGLPAGEGAEVLGGLGLVFAAAALLAVGLGLFLRSTAGSLVSVLGLMLVLPFVLAQLSVQFDWLIDVAAAMPGSSALFLIFGEGPSDDMTTTSARLTMAVWAAAAISAGGWRLLRTDANR